MPFEQHRTPAPATARGNNFAITDVKLASPVAVELFADIAEEMARQVKEAGDNKKNKSTQLRKFYDEITLWNEKIQQQATTEAKAQKYTELAPFIKMLKAKVAYARGREHVETTFEQLYTHLINQIDGADSLRNAKLFMEAFMGFYKAQEK